MSVSQSNLLISSHNDSRVCVRTHEVTNTVATGIPQNRRCGKTISLERLDASDAHVDYTFTEGKPGW